MRVCGGRRERSRSVVVAKVKVVCDYPRETGCCGADRRQCEGRGVLCYVGKRRESMLASCFGEYKPYF